MPRSASTAPEGASAWSYDPVNGAPMAVRRSPRFDAAAVEGEFLEPGQRFWVVEERAGQDGVTFLKLADGGWVFDSKPGVGSMCSRCVDCRRLIGKAVARAAARAGEQAVRSKYHHLPRRLVDDYSCEARRVLGSGAGGDVVLGVCRRTGRSVAVKHLEFAKARESERARLAQEMELALSIKESPHIVRVIGVYESHQRVSLVMEHLEGGELFDRVHDRGGQLPETEAKMAVHQVLLGLAHLHRRGIAHRDVKLENAVFDRRGGGRVKLIDFGLAADCRRAPPADAAGTPSYMAPEVVATSMRMRRSYGVEADLWSVGVLTFALLAGKLPFTGGSQRELMANISVGRYTLSSDRFAKVSEEGLDFIRCLLQVDPEQRPSAEQALAHSWFRQLARALEASPASACTSISRSEGSTQGEVSEQEDGSDTSGTWSQSSGDDERPPSRR